MKMDEINIMLNIDNLDKHYIYYLIDLIDIIKNDLK